MHHTKFDRVCPELFTIDPEVTFLNHGSFGATPRPVQLKQAQLRQQLESNPVRFMMRDLPILLEEARSTLAHFVGAQWQDIAFVPNTTFGVNGVLQSLSLRPGDEILVTNHTYGACKNAVDILTKKAGASVIVVDIPFPFLDGFDIPKTLADAVTPQTRLAMIDHISSVTAMVFPIQKIVDALKYKGVDTLIDGAHGPGMIDLNLDALDAAYYVGNLHKWACSPKGAAFLHARRDKQPTLQPAVISHGERYHRPEASPFHLRFDWLGTVDPTPYLCVPDSIDLLEKCMLGGWNEIRSRNHDLVLRGRQLICDALGQNPAVPDSMIGTIASIPLGKINMPPAYEDPFQTHLAKHHKVEILSGQWPIPNQFVMRISAHLYNCIEDYQRLADLLPKVLKNLATA